jgi:hypothetical protein
LDTVTGRLCKTYAWNDTASLPKGLPLCSDSEAVLPSLSAQTPITTGATKVYRGFIYRFDGTKWVKGGPIRHIDVDNPANGSGDQPYSDDQYDPLNLFSKEQKAKRLLTVDQIQAVANEFGVSYEEAREDARQQGYQVPAKR